MSDDPKKPQKHLWKDLKSDKDKHPQGDGFTKNAKPKILHSLDEVLNDAVTIPPKNASAGEVLPEIGYEDKERANSSVEQIIEQEQEFGMNSDRVQSTKSKDQPFAMMQESQSVENFDQLEGFGSLPVIEAQDEEEIHQPMIISNGSQFNTSLVRQVAKKKLHKTFFQLKEDFTNLSEIIKFQNVLCCEYFERSCEQITSELTLFARSQHLSEEKQKLRELEGKLEEKQYENQTLRYDNEQLARLKGKLQLKIQKLEQTSSSYSEQWAALEQSIRQKDLLIDELKASIQAIEEENESMNEAIFDYEQKRAQMDLEIQKRVNRQVEQRIAQNKSLTNGEKQHINKIESEDRDFYINEMAALEKEIENLSEKYLRQEEMFRIRTQDLAEKEEELARRELEVEYVMKEISLQKLALEKEGEDLRRRQYHLQDLQHQLKKKQIELEEMSREITLKEIEKRSHSNKRSQHNGNTSGDYGYIKYDDLPPKHDMTDYKVYGIRSDHGDSIIQNHTHVFSGRKNYAPQHIVDYSRPFRAENTRKSSQSKERERKFQTSNSLSRNYRNNARTHTGGFSNSKNKNPHNSHNNSDSTRLHDLGSKLERLREEIRKEIRDA